MGSDCREGRKRKEGGREAGRERHGRKEGRKEGRREGKMYCKKEEKKKVMSVRFGMGGRGGKEKRKKERN